MKYKQIPPPAGLKDYIRYFWTLESNDAATSPKTFSIIADGCPGLFIQVTGNDAFYDQNHKPWPRIFLYGQTTQHARIYSPGKFSAMGIYFQPSALKSIFGFNADELTDSCLDMNFVSAQQGLHLSEQLFNTSSVIDRINLLSSFLFCQIRKNNARVDKPTQYALSQIIQSKGRVSLRKLWESLGLSERSFERKFKQGVGVSPKLFSRICRFQASLDQLRNNNYDKLSDIAFENDYADQSHFIRAFKEFAGFSPYRFRKQSNEVVENFAELTQYHAK
jgi:AraC-like DNA-binding protein